MSHTHTPANVVDDDKHFRINPDTRTIERTAESDPVLVQFDHNSERFTFDIPKEVDGHDMSLCNSIQVHYINVSATDVSDTKSSIYEVDDFGPSESDPETLSLSWLIDQAGTKLVGPLYFAITFKCTSTYIDENGDVKVKPDYIWNTSPYKGVTVSDGINNNEKLGLEYYDVVDEWFATIDNAGEIAKQEAITAIQTATEQAKNSAKADIDKYTQQVIQNDLIPDALRISDILVQEKGQSEERIMSQNSVSQELDHLHNMLEIKTLAAVNDARAVCDEYVYKFESLMPLIALEPGLGDGDEFYGLKLGTKYRISGIDVTKSSTYKMEACWSFNVKVYDNLNNLVGDHDVFASHVLFSGTEHLTDKGYFDFTLLSIIKNANNSVTIKYRVDDTTSEVTVQYTTYVETMVDQFDVPVGGNFFLGSNDILDGEWTRQATATNYETVSEHRDNVSYKVTANNIADIRKTATNGLTDTYTISFDDGSTTTFNVKNGNGIDAVVLTDRGDYEDTYTIYLSNGSSKTFTVPNGGSVGVKKKVSGEIISVSDVSPLNHRVKVKARSKNLIPYPYAQGSGHTENGITFTVQEDGGILVNGTTSSTVANFILITRNSYTLPKGKYHLSLKNGISKQVYIVSGNDDTIPVLNETDRDIEIEDDSTLGYCVLQVGWNTTVDNLVVYPQLELGDTATDYVPYVDISTTKLTTCGKNYVTYPYSDTTKTDKGIQFTDFGKGHVGINGMPTEAAVFFVDRNGLDLEDGVEYEIVQSSNTRIKTIIAYKDETGSTKFVGTSFVWNSAYEYIYTYIQVDAGIEVNSIHVPIVKKLSDPITTYTPNLDGSVSDVGSITPVMNIFTDQPGIILDVEYNVPVKGDSAYDVAVQNGFKGTEAEWLASLKGKDGADGIGTNAEVVQELGDNTDKVISQKGVTDALSPIIAKTSGYRVEGINLISLDMASPKGEWWYNGVKYTSGNASTDASCSFKVSVDPNTTYYTQSYSAVDKTRAGKVASYLCWFDESGNFISSPSSGALLETVSPEGASYAMATFRIYENASDTEVSYLPYMSSVAIPDVFPPEGEEITFETLQADINDLKENSVDPEKSSTATLHLPEQYSLVVGDTFELFYKGIINAVNTDLFHIEIECAKGNPFKKRFIFTPTTDNIGTLPMTIKLFDLHHNLLDTKSVNLVVKAKAASPTTEKTVLYVTDSLGNGGYVPDEFNRRLAGSGGSPTADALKNISFIGTCKSLNNGVRYEGYGGWTFASYNVENKSNAYMWVTTTHDKTADDQHSTYKDSNGILWKIETIEANRIKIIRVSESGTLPSTGTLTWNADGVNHASIVYTASEQASGNPFWNESTSKVDFANYVTKQGKTTLDYVYVLLGWNSHPLSIYSYKTATKTFINNILTAYPNCKIVLLGLQIPSQEGVALNYGASGAYSNYYDLVNHVWNLNELYAEIAAEYDNVSFVNVCGQFDTENNMSSGSRTVNVRNSTTETYQTNGVHPAPSGYYQIADACYRDFIHKLQN